MPFNFAALSDIARAAGHVLRNAQVTAFEIHRDMRTIDEMNRQYIADHAGTVPHWDNYDSDGRRTNGSNQNRNGNGNNRRRNQSRNDERQRQRDRSFERQHPFLSRGLYNLMPHLGGYETGRGLTWNANGERWGDSFRRASDLINNMQEQRRNARAWESLGIDEPHERHHSTNRRDTNASPTINNNNRNALDSWRSPYGRQNFFDYLADSFDERAIRNEEQNRRIEESRRRAEEESKRRLAELQRISEQHEREFEEARERSIKQIQDQERKRADELRKAISYEVKRGSGIDLKKALLHQETNEINQNNSSISNEDRKAAQEKYRAFCELVRPSMQAYPELNKVFVDGREEYRKYLQTGHPDFLYGFQSRANAAYYLLDGRRSKGFEDKHRMELWKKVRRPEDTEATEYFRNNMNKDEQDETIRQIFRETAKTCRSLLKDNSGLNSINKSETAHFLEEARKAIRFYNVNSGFVNETQFADLKGKILHARRQAYEYKDFAERNKARYKQYCKDIAELNSNYGMNIPTYQFDDIGSDEIAKIYKLLEDAHAGKPLKYEPPEYASLDDDDPLIPIDNPYAKQQFDNMKAVSEFITDESQYISSDEMEAHDINVTKTQDGKYNVESPIPQSIVVNEADETKETAADILQEHYKGDNVVISLGGTQLPISTFENINFVAVDDNRFVPVIDTDKQDILIDSIIDSIEQKTQEDSDDELFTATPSMAVRAAAPSSATRSNAEAIKSSMNSGSDEEVWVSEHMRSGHFVNHYSRSRPHRS